MELVDAVVIHRNGGLSLVEVTNGPDGKPMGGRTFGLVVLSMAARAGLGLSLDEDLIAFAQKIRLKPAESIIGTFSIIPSADLPIVGEVSAYRQVSKEELAVAIKTRLEAALAQLRDNNIRPTMSAEELMNLTRGRDEPDPTGMTFEEAKSAKADLEAAVEHAAAKLKAFPKGPMGLTPDDVKFGPEFRAAKAAHEQAFKRLRSFNAVYVKLFKTELAEERRSRRAEQDESGPSPSM